MNKRLFFALISVMLAALVLTGCASPAETPAASTGGDQPYIPVISKGFQHQFWR